jgi:hypothetical protein
MKRVNDDLTPDLFAVPQPEHPVPGSADYAFEVSHLVSQVLKECPQDRWEIAAQMSRLSGADVSKNILDAWASPAREDHNIPLYRAALLEDVCGSHALTDWLAGKRGGRVAYGRETLNAELGRMVVMRQALDQKMRELKKLMGEM